MRKVIFSLLLLCGACLPLFSQTNAEKLESAVKMYNSTRSFADDLQPGKVEQEDVEKMKADLAKAIVLLDDVKENGTAEEAKVARYFMANFKYEIGFVYGMMGKNRDAYEILNSIKPDFEFFSSSAIFPLTYKFDSKNYSIKFDNFAPTLAEYYAGMSEICANISKYDESIEWSRKTLSFSYSTTWYKYIALNKLLEVKEKNGEWDKEMLDRGLEQIKLITELDTSYLRTIRDNGYQGADFGAKKIKTTLEKKPSLSLTGYYYGEAAPLLVKARKYSLALEFYRLALEAGYGAGNSFYLFEAARFAIEEESRSTAMLALNMLYDKGDAMLTCDEWDKLSTMYGQAGNAEKKKASADKANACRKKEKDRKKRAESGSLGFGFYVGVYPLPLATRFNRYRDYGGVVGLIAGKVAFEGSFKLINRNLVIAEDLRFNGIKQELAYYWDGSRTHLSIKFFPGSSYSSDRFYIGPIFEMVNRKYETIWTDVADANNVIVERDKKFNPTETSYNLFLNYGTQSIQKKFFVDAYFGIGVAYSKFDAGSQYENDVYVYSDALLENRKPTRFGPIIRMGMTMGFGMVKD
jgi:hypothetical protein